MRMTCTNLYVWFAEKVTCQHLFLVTGQKTCCSLAFIMWLVWSVVFTEGFLFRAKQHLLPLGSGKSSTSPNWQKMPCEWRYPTLLGKLHKPLRIVERKKLHVNLISTVFSTDTMWVMSTKEYPWREIFTSKDIFLLLQWLKFFFSFYFMTWHELKDDLICPLLLFLRVMIGSSPSAPQCLTCSLNEDRCQYNSAYFSSDASYYRVDCYGQLPTRIFILSIKSSVLGASVNNDLS